MWKDLIVLLKQLNDTYIESVGLGREKHNALVVLDFPKLEQLNKQEEKLTTRIRSLEEKRLHTMAELAKTEAGIEQDIKLSELIAKLPSSPVRDTLYQLYAELDKNVKQASELSENNRVLIRSAMQAVSYHLNRIGGIRADATYGNHGDEGSTHRQNFDFKA